jgi:hypothetical protein
MYAFVKNVYNVCLVMIMGVLLNSNLDSAQSKLMLMHGALANGTGTFQMCFSI